jgi:hypothetical protein
VFSHQPVSLFLTSISFLESLSAGVLLRLFGATLMVSHHFPADRPSGGLDA